MASQSARRGPRIKAIFGDFPALLQTRCNGLDDLIEASEVQAVEVGFEASVQLRPRRLVSMTFRWADVPKG